jgi:hypothetical protein
LKHLENEYETIKNDREPDRERGASPRGPMMDRAIDWNREAGPESDH